MKDDHEAVLTLAQKARNTFLGKDDAKKRLQTELYSALMQAVMAKNVAMVSTLLDAGAEVATADQWYPVTCAAIDSNMEEIVDLFLERGVDFSHSTPNVTALHSAARTGNASILRKLLELKKLDVNAVTQSMSSTLLHVAVQSGKEECVRLLLEHGAPYGYSDEQDRTPLHYAAMSNNVNVVRLLLEHGASVWAVDKQFGTPWLYSLLHKSDDSTEVSVKSLLEERQGSDFTSREFQGAKRYLHLAAAYGNDKGVRILLEGGADVNCVDDNGDTPLILAVRNKKLYAFSALLESSRCNLNHLNNDGECALSLLMDTPMSSAPLGSKLFTDWLVKAGANLDICLSSGQTLMARHVTDPDKVDWLLSNGADPNVRGSSGETPLHAAASSQHHNRKRLELLLDANVDLRFRDSQVTEEISRTPLVEAVLQGNISTAKTLYLAGCDPRGLRKAMTSAEGKECRENNQEADMFYRKLEENGSLSRPASLSQTARLAVLSSLGHKDVKNKITRLEIPSILHSYLDWKTFSAWKTEQEDITVCVCA